MKKFLNVFCGSVLVLCFLALCGIGTFIAYYYSPEQRGKRIDVVEAHVGAAFNATGGATRDRQRRVFSELRKALECDERIAAAHIIDFARMMEPEE